MALFFSCLMVGLIVIAVWKRNYKKETIDNILNEENKKEWLRFLFPMGLWIYDLLSKKQPAQNEEEREWAKALYVREDAKKKLQLQGARQMANFWICLFFASVLGIAVSFLPDTQIPKTELERPEFGQTKDYSLTVEGLEEGDQTIHVSVDGKEPETQGMMAVFDDAFDSVKEQILGENESLENVQTNLSLVSSTIYGIRVAWKSLTPELLDDFGVIQIQDIPPEGVTAQLQVKLSYSMYEQYYTLDVRLMMPKKDGFTLAQEIRQQNVDMPIVFLTAKTLKEDILEGFKIGADDYITKPFSMEELVFRVEAILRRVRGKKSKESTMYHIGKFTFDTQKQLLTINGEQTKLTTKENELLALLCAHANEILQRDFALKTIWIDDNYFNARSMDVYITKLRKHLKEDPQIEIINIHGKGYKLIVPDAE